MASPVSMNRKSVIIVVCALVILLAFNAGLLLYHFTNVSNNSWWVAHTNRVLSELQLVSSSVKDGEASIANQMGSPHLDHRADLAKAESEAFLHSNRIRMMTLDNPRQQEQCTALDNLLTKKFELLRNMYTLAKDKKTTQELHELSLGSKATLQLLEEQLQNMRDEEQALLAPRTLAAERSRITFYTVLLLTSVLSIAGIILGAQQILRYQRRATAAAFTNSVVSEIAQLALNDERARETADKIIQYLTEKFGFLAGRLLIYNSDHTLVALSSLGVKDESDSKVIPVSSTLFTTALKRDGFWIVDKVPKDFWHLSTSLGESLPRSIAIAKISFQGNVIGILEMASFQAISEDVRDVLNHTLETIGTSVNAALTRARLKDLLEETQAQSEELQSQQEELRTNNEELEAQTRALVAQQETLSTRNRDLNVTQLELEAKARDLAKSTQYKSDFLAKMSHELRTPLNGLMILSTLLIENKEGTLTEQQKEFARSINNAGNDLLLLISDILDLSKIEARKLAVRADKFSLKSLLASKKRTFTPQMDAKHLKFEITTKGDIDDFVLSTDRQRVEQILRNFISNAIKFTESGGVKLTAELSLKKDTITFAVTDTGVGIPADRQSLIFEAFEQADSSISRKYGGTGLGLTISRELAALLGGSIALESEEGKGSTFYLTIPTQLETVKHDSLAIENNYIMAEQKPAPTASQVTAPRSEYLEALATEAIGKLKKAAKTILVVEDEAQFRASIVGVAVANGFQVLEAEDGDIAMAILERYVPDAILLDIKLPGVSGLSILETIKKSSRLRHVPVHMISAMDFQQNALRMGALGYLTKPVTIEKVRSAIGRIQKMLSAKMRSVLVVEDDAVQLKAITELIAGDDIVVQPVKTGKEAIVALQTEGIDCVVLDLSLPDMSGHDLLDKLREMEISLPPIVIYTGKDLSFEEEEYLRKYSESIIIKGVRSPERLLDEVNLFLHRIESMLPGDKQLMISKLRSQAHSFAGKTVLIVDDDIRNVFALTNALESKGFNVRMARNGLEGVAAVKEHTDIDIVLMDIMMPKMDGFEAMRTLRKDEDPRVRKIPIIALTAKAMREDHEKCIEAGANDYLSKPVNLNNLSTVLGVWINSAT